MISSSDVYSGNNMTKQELYNSVENDEATFIEEIPQAKDTYELVHELNGVRFSVFAYGHERYLVEDVVEIKEGE